MKVSILFLLMLAGCAPVVTNFNQTVSCANGYKSGPAVVLSYWDMDTNEMIILEQDRGTVFVPLDGPEGAGRCVFTTRH